jgi:hypothetical protein
MVDLDRVYELKKLLRSLMSQFLKLLDILVREPDKVGFYFYFKGNHMQES